MGYRIQWTLIAPDSFSPEADDPEAQELLEKLSESGYDVSAVTKKTDNDLEWTRNGFRLEGFEWRRDRKKSNIYRYGEFGIEADKMFKELSRQYEGLFTLDATGEDGEAWRVYIRNGMAYEVKPQFPNFDESRLQ